MIHFILIRHGETLWTREKRYQGSTNTKLTAKGRKQIQRFVQTVKAYKPDVIFTSALDRAKESANILAKPLKMKPKIDARLNELRFGVWEGKTGAELFEAKDPTYMKWATGQLITPKGGESLRSLQQRVKSFVKEQIKKYHNKKIIIVTHGGAIRVFLTHLLKLPKEHMSDFRIDTGTMTIIGVYQYSNQLVLFNSPKPQKGIIPASCA